MEAECVLWSRDFAMEELVRAIAHHFIYFFPYNKLF